MKRYLLPLLLAAVALCSCDDDTSTIGNIVMPKADGMTAIDTLFTLDSHTVKVDSVLANTSTCYLGCVVDPEFHIQTTSSFLAQFHVPDGFSLPALSKMGAVGGTVEADSCDIRIYIDKFYGDSLTTMKLRVTELDPDKTLAEGQTYYTNIRPADYLSATPTTSKTISYAVKDLTRPDSETDGTTYYRQIPIKMPKDYGTRLLQTYYDHPDYFQNSYWFTHNVCPGFYFEHAGGVGAMIQSYSIAMNVYFRYHTTTTEGNDTIVDGVERFGATQEVLQANSVNNTLPGALTDAEIQADTCTYVKSPSGYYTEITLPVDEMCAGSHYADSINQAKIVIPKYDSQATDGLQAEAPQYLLLVPKTRMNAFFESGTLPDSYYTFLSNRCSATANYYQFSNIAQLITSMKIERDKAAEVTSSMSEAERQEKYAEFAAKEENADWNKVLLVPVDASYAKTSSTSSTYVLRSVKHQLGLRSARIQGGQGQPLQMEVIYSHYNR